MTSILSAGSRAEGVSRPSGIDRRTLIGAGAATAALGAQLPASPATAALPSGTPMRIDAHTHFAPLKFLDFAENAEGRPFPLARLYRSKPALTEIKPRVDLLDRNEVDINVLIPVPWIEAFHGINADPQLAARRHG